VEHTRSNIAEQPTEHRPERRKNPRLRMLIDDLKAAIEENRRELEMQSLRMAKMRSEIEALKHSRHSTD
jgi:hypothetical protein